MLNCDKFCRQKRVKTMLEGFSETMTLEDRKIFKNTIMTSAQEAPICGQNPR
jgi:hypothetical protein